jgi:hypothetical protein
MLTVRESRRQPKKYRREQRKNDYSGFITFTTGRRSNKKRARDPEAARSIHSLENLTLN